MPEMKDSRLTWIDEIPKDWNVNRMKYLFSFGKGLSITKENLIEDGLAVISYGQIHSKNNDGVDVKESLKRFVSPMYRQLFPNAEVKEHDFVFADTSEDYDGAGNCVYKRDDSILFGGYHVVIAHSRVNQDNRYFAYLFQTDEWRKQIRERISGVKVFSITQKNISDASIIVPPYVTQQRIAHFLDSKCLEIDNLTVDIQLEIKTLEQYKKSVITEAVTKGLDPDIEMKESGIDWIGKIPRHWNVYRIADLYEDRNERGNDNLPVLTVSINSGVSDKELDDSEKDRVFLRSEDKTKYKRVYPGDLTYNMMRAWQGGMGAVRVDGMVSPAYVVAKPTGRAKIDSRFIEALLRCPLGIEEMNRYSYGIMDFRKRLYWPQFRIIKIALPDIQEQKTIADYIDAKTAEIDSVIRIKEKQLETLADYKKSLIYEYVTGKKEVPSYESERGEGLDSNIILLGMIADKLGSEIRGKIQVQKMLYLLNVHLGLNYNVQYYRYAHGPYDLQLDHYVDVLVKKHWYKVRHQGGDLLVPGENHTDFVKQYGNMFGERQDEIDGLISFLKPMKTSQVERIATLFAAWNDFILDGNAEPDDGQIIHEVTTNWTDNKANTQYSTWQDTLQKMKINGIVPTGTGLHTRPKE